MSKSYVKELVRVYESVFQDAKYAYPTLAGELDKSFSRLCRVADASGRILFLGWLPAIGKHLDRCLAKGEYNPSGLHFHKCGPHGGKIPIFLRELYLLVFRSDGILLDEPDITAIAFLRQILLMCKKATVRCGSTEEEAEKASFVLLDASLPEPESFWDGNAPSVADALGTYKGFALSEIYKPRLEDSRTRYPSLHPIFLRNLDIVSGLLSSALGVYDPLVWNHRHGPGMVSDVRLEGNKYSFPNWPERLESAFPIADHGFHSYSAWAGDDGRPLEVTSNEGASKLVAVPKSFDKPRLIAAEPVANMWCQQNVWHFMRTRTERTWLGKFVKFGDQTQNQNLCLRGSKDGSLITVDLKSASDCVTCHAVGQLFRGNPRLLLALQATRTRFCNLELHGEELQVALRKFSTMGNACTFPVESMLFLSIALAAVFTSRGVRPTKGGVEALVGQVTVFGDDIIVPRDCRECLYGALEVLHFRVNATKTFDTGLFRESCGVDAYHGVEVTPAYWHAPYRRKCPETFASTIATANNFYKKFMVNAAECLAATVRHRFVPMVSMSSGVLGLQSFVKPPPPLLKRRWNRHTQQEEILVHSLIAIGCKEPTNDDSAILQFLTESPSPYENWESGAPQRPCLEVRARWVPLAVVMS